MKETEFLGNTQLWRGLPPEQLEAVGEIAIAQTYNKGEIIFLEGDEVEGFYVVKSGKVKVYKVAATGKEQIFHIFDSGEHFAEVPAFDGECYPANAAALIETELLFFPRPSMLKLLMEQPSLAINMLAIFARHLRRFARIIEDLSLKEVPERLAAYLLSQESEEVELEINKSQLAAFLGTIPETLSRVFSKLSHQRLIEVEGAKIKILNREGLQRLAKISH